MATIYNSDLTKELVDAGKIQVSRDSIPTQIADKVVPVMEVNPRLTRYSNIVRHSNLDNTTSATIYTVPSGKSFVLTGASLNFLKDATATATTIYISIVIGGATQRLLHFKTLTLTAEQRELSISFPFPIRVDDGSSINVVSDTDVANIKAGASIVGILLDNIKA